MRLGLSSAAAPAASLGELLEAAARRGLGSVELVEGHGHGIDPGMATPGDAEIAAARVRDAALELAGFRLAEDGPVPGPEEIEALGRLAVALGAPVLIPLTDGGPGDPGARVRAARAAMGVVEGGAPALGMLPRTFADMSVLDALPAELPLAWEADPAAGSLAERGSELWSRVGPRLRHVVLRGGGPESTEQEGRGVGSLMARLAVAGYGGTVALAPSSPRYRVIWDAWLGRRGGWGCGSRNEDRTLVGLGGVA